MKTTKTIQRNVIVLALLTAVSGSAFADTSYKYRISSKGLKRPGHSGPGLPGGSPTVPGGSPTTPGGSVPDGTGNPAPGGGTTTPVTPPVTPPAPPPAPADVTASFKVYRSGLTFNRTTSVYTGRAEFTNEGTSPVAGPFFFQMRDLPAGVTLQNPSGAYNGHPYLTVDVSAIAPGQTVVLPTEFLNPQKVSITYSFTLYKGTPH